MRREFCDIETCQNPSAKDVRVSVNRPSDQVRSLCAACEEAYSIGVQHGTMVAGAKPAMLQLTRKKGSAVALAVSGRPPKGSLRVVYIIDMTATDPLGAARQAHRIMADRDSLPPVLEVIDPRGRIVTIDLSQQRPA